MFFEPAASPHFFTPEHVQFRDALRAFVEAEIAPHVDAWDEAGRVPRELYHKAPEVGLLGVGFPEIYGGTPASPDINDAMIYFATNDGFLHAVDPLTGIEQWSFIPPDFLDDQVDMFRNDPSPVIHLLAGHLCRVGAGLLFPDRLHLPETETNP